MSRQVSQPTQINKGTINNFNFGVSLRDHFAGLAMQGILANHYSSGITFQTIVKDAYEVADLMLEQRKEAS